MYQVIIYDNSGQYPRVMHRENFSNEECAWSWYEMKDKEKILLKNNLNWNLSVWVIVFQFSKVKYEYLGEHLSPLFIYRV